MRNWTVALTSVCLWAGVAMPLHAQAEEWPSRPITWIVPFTAGGATDLLGREIAEHVGRQLKQTIIVENVGGAGGTIGAAKAARSASDGYTFLVGHIGYMAAAPTLYSKLPYVPLKDLVAVTRFPDTPMVLLVNSKSKFRTTDDLLEAAKAGPGKVKFANAGVGSVSHLTEELLASRAGVQFSSIAYRGTPQAITDLMGGYVDAVFDQTNTALANVASGRLRAIAITSAKPMPQYPDAKPLDSNPKYGFHAATWYGLYAPKGTSSAIIQKMYKAYITAMKDESWRQSMASRGIQLLSDADSSPAAFTKFTASEIERWRQVIQAAHIQVR